MKRRTLRQLRLQRQPPDHREVSLVALNAGGGEILHEDGVHDHQKP